MQSYRLSSRHVGMLTIALLSILLAACSNATITVSATTATPAGTLVAAATTGTPASGGGGPINPTPTPVNTSTCKSLIPGGVALIGSDPKAIPIPAYTIATDLATSGGGDGQFTIQVKYICTSGMTLQDVFAFFNTQMANRGWLHSNYFPYDAETETTASTYTWAQGTTYVTLENYLDRAGGAATYNMQIAHAPPPPTCTTVQYTGATYTNGYIYYLFAQPAYPNITAGFDHIALPPLTKIAFDAAAGNRYASLCSAGSPAMVKAFMDKHLRAAGWVAQGGNYYLYANTFGLYLDVGDGAQIKASLHWYNPAAYGP